MISISAQLASVLFCKRSAASQERRGVSCISSAGMLNDGERFQGCAMLSDARCLSDSSNCIAGFEGARSSKWFKIT